jgi:hypothetical protein
MCYQHLPRRRLQTVQRYHGGSNARCSLRLLSAFRRSVARDLPQPRRLRRARLVDEVGKYAYGNASCFELSLCLSRACLGKMVTFSIEMAQNWRFFTVFDIEQLSATPVLDEVAMIEDDL